MAFFGLTQLGPQSTFNVNLISLQNYTCFSEDDFRASFDKHSGGAASIPLDKVGPMLEGVFGGFAPEQEMEALLAALQPSQVAVMLWLPVPAAVGRSAAFQRT